MRISDWSSDVCSSDLRMLRLPHAPDQCRRLLCSEHLGDLLQLVAGYAGYAFHLVRRILLHLLADIVHRVDSLGDEFLVLPSVLEDVPEHAPEHRDIGAGANAHILGRMCSRDRKSTRLNSSH